MPINIPRDLPARTALEDENIFVMTDARAETQDIRPLRIIIVNLMPAKISAELQLLRLLGNSPLQVDISLLRMDNHQSKNTPQDHLDRFYKTFDEVKSEKYDGMIITGAPVERIPFEEVDYWDELKTIMDYSVQNVFSTLYICWGAQAGLYHRFGIPKYTLPHKLSGVYPHFICKPKEKLFRGFDDIFNAPQSRHTEVLKLDIEECSNLEILSESEEAGVALVIARDTREIFMTGHLEYEADTLKQEYLRDVAAGLSVSIPEHYFPQDNPENTPYVTWRAHAHLFFSNWLNYYVYQETPFDLKQGLANRAAQPVKRLIKKVITKARSF